ncbi:MAG: DNA-directed RNA polymerase subunit K [Acidilobus sp.]|uniref:DNA-directed RNA polymerase subunit K n=1 Tax=Acidilobus sp. 7A TaxID=1577685 RepID=UPI000E3E0D52|nr:DNA-directed RNA polymerase subunit K [Acidilobus sp. 7A]
MSGQVKLYPTTKEEIVIGPPYLTKYERAKIIGLRALQLDSGALPLVDLEKVNVKRDPIEIATYELDHGLLPLSVVRYTPSGLVQVIPIKLLTQ